MKRTRGGDAYRDCPVWSSSNCEARGVSLAEKKTVTTERDRHYHHVDHEEEEGRDTVEQQDTKVEGSRALEHERAHDVSRGKPGRQPVDVNGEEGRRGGLATVRCYRVEHGGLEAEHACERVQHGERQESLAEPAALVGQGGEEVANYLGQRVESLSSRGRGGGEKVVAQLEVGLGGRVDGVGGRAAGGAGVQKWREVG